MTITTSQLNTTTDLALVWSEADTNLWVADAGGVFGGSIDADSGRHIARDPFGRERGTFDTLEDAKRFLTSFMAHPAMTRYLRSAEKPAI